MIFKYIFLHTVNAYQIIVQAKSLDAAYKNLGVALGISKVIQKDFILYKVEQI